MTSKTNHPQTRSRVMDALSQIIGLPLTASRRAADMRTFQFGTLRQVDRGSTGEFALHIQCPWRIDGPDGIVTGRLDLWEPAGDEPKRNIEDWDYEKSPNLQDDRMERLLARRGSLMVVTSADADEFGGASITFDDAFVLRLFPAGTRGEDWRFFRPTTSVPHFVIVGGAVERDADQDTQT
jgi:hypothetical protein